MVDPKTNPHLPKRIMAQFNEIGFIAEITFFLPEPIPSI